MAIVTKRISEFTTVAPTSADYLLANQGGNTYTVRLSAVNQLASATTINNINGTTKDVLVNKLKGDFIQVPNPPPAEDIDDQILVYSGGGQWDVGLLSNLLKSMASSGPVLKFGEQQANAFATGVWVGKDGKVYGFGNQEYFTVDASNTDMPIITPRVIRFWDTGNEDYLYNHPNVTVVDIKFAGYQICALLSDGTVWISGYTGIYNGFGNTSDPATYTYGFRKVVFSDNASIQQISMNGSGTGTGNECYAAISTTGNLYTWGANQFGQCGIGGTTTIYTPTKITNTGIAGKASKVFVGGGNNNTGINTVVITNDGKAWVAGYNGLGQLGQGNTTNVTTGFVQARTNSSTFLTNAKDIGFSPWGACRQQYIILNDGSLWGAGDNTWGQLGDGTRTESWFFKRIGTLTRIAKMMCAGTNNGISCIAFTSTGFAYTWGYNGSGQLGTSTTNDQLTPYTISSSGVTDIFISCTFGTGHTFGYLKNKHLYSSGYNAFTTPAGAITQNNFYPAHVDNVKDVLFLPINGNTGSTFVLTEEGHIYGWGISTNYELGPTLAVGYSPIKLT